MMSAVIMLVRARRRGKGLPVSSVSLPLTQTQEYKAGIKFSFVCSSAPHGAVPVVPGSG